MTGKLIGVGVGPGDPELLTLKAMRFIQNAPVLAYTVDGKGNSYARQTVEKYIRAEQKDLPLVFSMSAQRTDRLNARQAAGRKVFEVLATGLDVVFITEGDPLLYSTFRHLLSEMPPEVPVEVCPGISAMFSAAAGACFPLAIEGQAVRVAPAEAAIGHIREWLGQGNSVVLFKITRWLGAIAQEIIASGLVCKAVLVERASTGEEVIIRDVNEWSKRDTPYFSIILLHPVEIPGGIE